MYVYVFVGIHVDTEVSVCVCVCVCVCVGGLVGGWVDLGGFGYMNACTFMYVCGSGEVDACQYVCGLMWVD